MERNFLLFFDIKNMNIIGKNIHIFDGDIKGKLIRVKKRCSIGISFFVSVDGVVHEKRIKYLDEFEILN